ncbi:MAG TPA: YaiI/YqxD family protein [Bacillota bacterium]|nr:YaiI/YqxD family protein [Bacillota bacterium]
MHIYVDADACPVIPTVINVAAGYGLSVTLVKSYSHFSHDPLPNHVHVVYVDSGADQADFKIVQLSNEKDLIITQDYGLASLVLKKGCYAIHHSGMEYTEENINRLLDQRHLSALARRSGERTKGPKKYSPDQRYHFQQTLTQMLDEYA